MGYTQCCMMMLLASIVSMGRPMGFPTFGRARLASQPAACPRQPKQIRRPGWTRNPRQREVLPLLVEGLPIRK
jgi:hypothetical protein